MKTKQHAQFKRGDEVTWLSQASGYRKRKTGVVVCVVGKFAEPAKKYRPRKHFIVTIGRDHISYVVKVGNELYWPLVKNLRPVRHSRRKGLEVVS